MPAPAAAETKSVPQESVPSIVLVPFTVSVQVPGQDTEPRSQCSADVPLIATRGAGAGRGPRLVDQLERDAPRDQRGAVEADAASTGESRAVEVVKAGVEHGARACACGLERGDRVGPEGRSARGQGLGGDRG